MFGQDSSLDPNLLAQGLWNYVGNNGGNNRIPQIMGQAPPVMDHMGAPAGIVPGPGAGIGGGVAALGAPDPLAAGMPAVAAPAVPNPAGQPIGAPSPMPLANVGNKPPAAPAPAPMQNASQSGNHQGQFGFGMQNSAGLYS